MAFTYTVEYLGQRLLYDLRMNLFRKVLGLGHDYFDRTAVGATLTNITNDVEAIRQFISQGLVSLVGDSFQVVVILGAKLLINPRLALAAFVSLPFFGVRLGAAYLLLDELTVSSDVHYRFGDGIALDPQFHLGAGVEYRPLDFLHLRGGLALVTGGLQYGGGVSFILGPVDLSAAAAGQPGGVIAQVGLSFGNRQPRQSGATPPSDRQ